ncbi:hypothetical protein PUN28_007485 [Cardiocondyla obscurior]
MIDNNDVPFDNNEVHVIQNTLIKSTNSLINQTGNAFLPILDRVLPTCSKDTFSKYGLFWVVNTVKVLENIHISMKDLTLACKVLGVLVEYCKEIPELHKQISMQYVKQLINSLNGLQLDAKRGAVYYLLAVLLYHYPEVCEKFQEQIKKMILLQVDSKQENLVNASARCYILLSKATERSFKPQPSKAMYNATMYNEALLCNNLHAIIDELFSGSIEMENVDIWDQLELPSISTTDTIQYYYDQKQRFKNLCIYLSSMLSGYEAKNSVLPHDILRVLCRGLAITPLSLKNKTAFKEQMLYIILPKLHICLLKVLDAFITGFAQELIPYGATILQLFQQTLRWTNTIFENQTTFSDNKPFKNVRICVYKCLCSWLTNTGSLSGIETFGNDCFSCILKDITPERDCMLLMQQKMQHMSKRAVKRFKHSQYENSTILNNKDNSRNNRHLDADLCREALITLQNILFSGSVLLKQTFYKNVQNIVICLLYDLYLNSTEHNFYKNHNLCRLELFRVLKALQMNPHVTLAFPVQFYLEISHMAAYDIDLSIVQEAKLTSAELEKIVHPIAPTLQLPRQNPDNNVVFEEIEETVTTGSDKRNRAEKELLENVDAVPLHKRQKITPTQCEIIENKNDTEEDNRIDINKSQVDAEINKEIEEKRTENAPQEQDKVQNEKESDLAAFFNTQNEKQHKRLEDSLCTDKENNKTEKSNEISEQVEKSQSDTNGWETLDDDVIESLKLFHNEVQSDD